MTDQPWYQKTTIYHIYPRSFYDSNGDGIGDLPGIIQKLDYVRHLGFETIWISPFFASPQMDLGYDVSDYTTIAPEYGTMEDVSQLIEEVHRRGMRILLDLVMNHTSIEHPWFLESKSSRDNLKADWYIWRDKPNNWNSITGGSGWHFVEERGQYYWASFLPFQPDLNYRNPVVKETMFNLMRFWLEKGVDGFRLDIINVVYKDAAFRDNPFSTKFFQTEYDYSSFFQEARFSVNQPESFSFAKELRRVIDPFGEKLLLGEAAAKRDVLRNYLGSDKHEGLGLIFNFEMLNFKFTADYFRDLIQNSEESFSEPFMPVYVFSNLDRRRSIKRLGDEVRKAKLLYLLQFTVRGVPCMYYGEEIGMTDAKFPFGTAIDPIPHKFKHVPRFIPDSIGFLINRDEVRTPMQWNAARNAGFSTAEKTWLPVHENFRQVNVEAENKDAASLLNTVRTLLQIRSQVHALHEGSLELMENLPENVLGYTRSVDGEKILILLNFDEKSKEFQTGTKEVIFRLSERSRLDGNKVHLEGYGGLILK
jgi:oligo-1,6-glucosidase/alpha-glucosidase